MRDWDLEKSQVLEHPQFIQHEPRLDQARPIVKPHDPKLFKIDRLSGRQVAQQRPLECRADRPARRHQVALTQNLVNDPLLAGEGLEHDAEALGEAQFHKAWTDGQHRWMQPAIADAMMILSGVRSQIRVSQPEEQGDVEPRRGSAERTHGLSVREIEVLRLLATGKTNRSIADDLVLSERTVSHHVASILGKLGVSTRSAATAWAVKKGFI